MYKTVRNIAMGLLAALWVGLALLLWFLPETELSTAERRPLQQMPGLRVETLLNGTFMEQFNAYTLDQFPLRDTFRSIKAVFSQNVLMQKDNNGIYMAEGHAAKLEYPLNPVSVSYAMKKINAIYQTYLQDTDSKIYMAIVPDKGYYLAEKNGYLAMDYETLFRMVQEESTWAQTVDLTRWLSVSHYYRTDTHWRQEQLLPVAQGLCRAMGVTEPREEDYTKTCLTQQFYGVYYAQAALPMKPDTLYVMENPGLSDCRVYNHEIGRYTPVYDLEKLSSADPYEVYLSGAQALLTVENPNAKTDRELIVFRDSFAGALVPLLVENYRSVTLVDIRYIPSAMLGEYLNFQGQDVLFMYSTLLLNSSGSLK